MTQRKNKHSPLNLRHSKYQRRNHRNNKKKKKNQRKSSVQLATNCRAVLSRSHAPPNKYSHRYFSVKQKRHQPGIRGSAGHTQKFSVMQFVESVGPRWASRATGHHWARRRWQIHNHTSCRRVVVRQEAFCTVV